MLGMSKMQRWGGGNVGTPPNGNVSTTGWGVGAAAGEKGGKGVREKELMNDLDKEGETVFEVGEEEDEDEDDQDEKQNGQADVVVHDPWAQNEKRPSNEGEPHSFLSISRYNLNKTIPYSPIPITQFPYHLRNCNTRCYINQCRQYSRNQLRYRNDKLAGTPALARRRA
jgi:hypothetical protein